MAQTKLCSDIEIPKEVYNKWKDFIKLVGNIILSIKQIPELEGKFKELLKRVDTILNLMILEGNFQNHLRGRRL